jgi:hypothetical protein
MANVGSDASNDEGCKCKKEVGLRRGADLDIETPIGDGDTVAPLHNLAGRDPLRRRLVTALEPNDHGAVVARLSGTVGEDSGDLTLTVGQIDEEGGVVIGGCRVASNVVAIERLARELRGTRT